MYIWRNELISRIYRFVFLAFFTYIVKRALKPDFPQKSLGNCIMIDGKEGRRRRIAGDRMRMSKVIGIVSSPTTECDHKRKRLATSSRATDSLLVIKSLGRHVGLIY